ncbi:hypothetical protein C8R42DRAFT_640727 [Lentinula raphanica]|nr:hypothetical protein C8R42DRAFT_640727 [Lentinula raphanica]
MITVLVTADGFFTVFGMGSTAGFSDSWGLYTARVQQTPGIERKVQRPKMLLHKPREFGLTLSTERIWMRIPCMDMNGFLKLSLESSWSLEGGRDGAVADEGLGTGGCRAQENHWVLLANLKSFASRCRYDVQREATADNGEELKTLQSEQPITSLDEEGSGIGIVHVQVEDGWFSSRLGGDGGQRTFYSKSNATTGPESSVLDAAKFIARKWILLQDVLINNHTSLYTFDNNCQLSRTTIAKKYYTQGKTLKISAAALPLLSQAKDKTPGNKKPSSKIFIIAVRESMKLKSALSSRFNGVNGIGQAIGWLLRANDSSRQLVNSTVSMGQFTKISIQSEESIMSPRVFTHKQRDSMFPSARVYFCLNEFQVVCLIARIEQHTKMNESKNVYHSMEHQSKVPLIRSSRSKMFNWHFRSKSIVQVRDTSQSQQYKFGIRVKVYYWPKNGFIVLQLVTSACYPTVQFESIPGSAELQYFQCQRDDR